MNHCNPGRVIKFEESKSALKINQNIINYLTAAEELKLCMFDLDDLRFTLNSNNGSKKVEESVLSLQKMVIFKFIDVYLQFLIYVLKFR